MSIVGMIVMTLQMYSSNPHALFSGYEINIAEPPAHGMGAQPDFT